MPRTLVLSRSSFFALLGALAAGAACNGAGPDPIPPGPELAVSAVPPPPISGGTLIVTQANQAVAADPERDQVWVADLESRSVVAQIALQAGDEPGRLVEDGSGKVHVALRRGGALVTLDPASGKVVDRRSVCPAPRGVAYDKAQDLIHVACEGGELVSLPAAGGTATRKLRLARDLRDVIVDGDHLLVSRFRAAELLSIDKDGKVSASSKPPTFEPADTSGLSPTPAKTYEPSVAWRTVAMPSGGAMMLHQRAMGTAVTLKPGGYYADAGCDGSIIHAAITVMRSLQGGVKSATEIGGAAAFPSIALPVDVAVAPDGEDIAFVGAGSDLVVRAHTSFLEADAGSGNCSPEMTGQNVAGEPVAVAFDKTGRVVVQTRSPSLVVLTQSGEESSVSFELALPGDSRADTAHDLFHKSPNGFSGIACASCHPEGHHDGRTWFFTTPEGGSIQRRTQDVGLGGGLLDTAPFHWSGDLDDITAVMGEVFVSRMGGQDPGPHKIRLFSTWIDQLPAMIPSTDADAATISRGEALFKSEAVGCAKCHAGAKLTDNKSVDVGTGQALQVPSLIGVAGRGALMHDGCVNGLRDRFTNACAGGDKHGHVSQLTPAQIDDLVGYLESL